MSIAQHISETDYELIVASEPDRQWELAEGQLREKPGMTWAHGSIVAFLSHLLQAQLDRRQFEVRINEGRVRRSPATIFIPDLLVVPASFGQEFAERPEALAIFTRPVPLVVEVWSRSTGTYDVEAKLPEYQQRGDLEIWLIHPYDRTLTSWTRQPDGSYLSIVYRGGIVAPAALPNVTIDLTELFGT
jgi:Uma2 family endonuclease